MGIQSTTELTRTEAEARAVDRLDEESAETVQRYLEIVERRLRCGNKLSRQLIAKALTNEELEEILDEQFDNYLIRG